VNKGIRKRLYEIINGNKEGVFNLSFESYESGNIYGIPIKTKTLL
jgi:hypothetical protein